MEQQGYKACMGLLKLADKYTPERLENACRKALTFTPDVHIYTVALPVAGIYLITTAKRVLDFNKTGWFNSIVKYPA